MKNLQLFWDERSVSNDKVTLCRLGSLRLWVGKASKEWGYAIERGESLAICDMNEVPLDVVPDNLEWQRIAFRNAPGGFRVNPIFPDRPVVVRPAFPVMIPVKESATFYALVPVGVELVTIDGGKEVILGRMPSRVLSDTWFGDYESGLLCYSLAFSAERDVESLEMCPHHVIVPIHLTNNSKEDLTFEKLCLRTQYLSLYTTPKQMWSSDVVISHEAGTVVSSVKYPKSSAGGNDLKLIAEPKEVPDRSGFQRLTFAGSYTANDFKFNTV